MDGAHVSGHPMTGPNTAAEQGGHEPVSHDATFGELYGPLGLHVPTREEMLAAALWWAEARGLEVFPVEPGGKRPAIPRGFKSASAHPVRVRNWYEGQYAGYNLATPTGAPGDDVLDIDHRATGSGWAAFNRLKAAGLLRGAHQLRATPSGGAHLCFAGTSQRCGSLRDLFLDFKAVGGYVLLPPSHIQGHPYQLIDDRARTGAVLDWEACKRLLRPPAPVRRIWVGRHGGRVDHLPAWLAEQAEGNRNRGLYWAACRAAEAGDEAVLAGLAAAAVQAGLDEDEARRTVASAVRSVNDGR
jgi:Bifunctional DNA primase/polymerase, N-terminal